MDLPSSVSDDEAAVTGVLADYYRAFSTLEIQAILPYFHEPSLLIAPVGVLAAPTSAALSAVFTTSIDDLRAREYGRSELSVRSFRSLSATAAMVTGVALRYKLDGQELERVGVTYILHKADARWRIAVLILHDSDDVARKE